MLNLPNDWNEFLDIDTNFPKLKEFLGSVSKSYLRDEVYPSVENIFRAFELCKPGDIKVVILGQDPYHTSGVADGLAFSTSRENKVPPSLRNIFKEISLEYKSGNNYSPDLSRWANQGVLLLNTSLTVCKGVPLSHKELGWENFTDIVISNISTKLSNVVFMIWGNFAKTKINLIDINKHKILVSPHPSPLSANRGFLGNGHFHACNEYLKSKNIIQIQWN